MEREFEEVSHPSDIALRIRGRDLGELFINAARGMAWLLADPATVAPITTVPIELTAYDAETLLVSWLGELLYLSERDGSVFTVFEIEEITPTYLRGVAQGGPAQEIRQPIKAVTFSNLEIRSTPHGLETVVVFDV